MRAFLAKNCCARDLAGVEDDFIVMVLSPCEADAVRARLALQPREATESLAAMRVDSAYYALAALSGR